MRHPLKNIVTLLLLTGLATASRADEAGEKGRDIFNKHRQSVVTVEVVQKVPASGRSGPREAKEDLTGTVVDPSGLVVIALSSADPFELARKLSENYKEELEISEVKIMLEDGTELPAEIVLRDKDLDLAFIRPKSKLASPMTAIDLTKAGTAQTLDQVITLNRLKRGAGRAYSASVERIAAVVQKPRTFYIPDSAMTATAMGSPAFSLDGNLLGIFVMRAVNAQGSGNARDSLTSIILPASEISKGASQAPDAKGGGEDEKKDAPKDATDAAPKADAPK